MTETLPLVEGGKELPVKGLLLIRNGGQYWVSICFTAQSNRTLTKSDPTHPDWEIKNISRQQDLKKTICDALVSLGYEVTFKKIKNSFISFSLAQT